MWQQREGRRRKRGRDRKEGQMKELPWQQNEISFLTRWKGVYLPRNTRTRRKGGLGKVRGCRGRPCVVSGPLPWMFLGVWFHISLGNDCLMEKLGALKMRKENENINGSRLVPITTEAQLVGFAAVNIATYSWVTNCHVIMWRGRLRTHSHVHIRACYTL